jgi:RIO-like serine/threonine protein kinase
MIENRLGPLRSKAYFIARYAEGTNIGKLAQSGIIMEEKAKNLARLFAEIIKILKDSGCSHGDLKATNFILSDERLVVMDLDGMRRYRIQALLWNRVKKDCRRLLKNWENHPRIKKIFDKHLNLTL